MRKLVFGLMLVFLVLNLILAAIFTSFAMVVSGNSIVTALFLHSAVGWFLATSAHIILCSEEGLK